MVYFKTWKDMYLFLKKYHNFSCLQCKHYHTDLSDDEVYSDSEYAMFFCPHHIAMVRFDFQQSCVDWESKDGVKLADIKDQDFDVYSIDDHVLDILDGIDDPISIQDIDDLISQEGV